MSANFPTSLDDNTSLHLVEDAVTDVLDEHHNDVKDAIIATETKVGTGADTPTDGDYLKGNGVGTSEWADFDTDVAANSAVADNTTHAGSSGADHSYIDQNVTTTGTPTFETLALTGTSGTLNLTSASDGGDFNIFTSNGDQTLAFYGSAGNILNVKLLDGNLTVTDGNIIVGGTVDGIDIATDVGANTTHKTSSGVDHSYIDQDVTNGASPTFGAANISGFAADAIDAITEIKSTIKSGSDATLITGTKGTDGDLAIWDANGDLVDGPTPPTGEIAGLTDTQTLTNKTLTSPTLKGTINGWIDPDVTFTYASATTFTITGDYSSILQKCDKIKLTQTTTKYFYIVSVSYSDPNTTVTVTAGNDYSLADAAITANYYSHIENPIGFPHWFDLTAPTYTGSGDLTFGSFTTHHAKFSILGNQVTLIFRATGTAGGTTSSRISAEFNSEFPDGTQDVFTGCYIKNNNIQEVGTLQAFGGSRRLDFRRNSAENWTLAANTEITAMLIYNI